MLNETNHEEALRYNAIAERIKIYAGIVLYTACLFGSLMNMLTFLRRTYYNRSCSLYLLAASIFDFIQLNLEPLPNIFHYALRFDGTVRSLVLCKLKSYAVFVVSVTSATLTVLVAIDRYVLSSRDTARWKYCTRAIAVRCIQSCVVFWIFVSIPIAFCYTCFNHPSEPVTLICSNPSSSIKCFTVQLVYVCLFNGFFPPLVMMFFGCLAYVNVHQLQKRSLVKSARIQQLNYQLSSMLILQSIKSSFSSMPYATFVRARRREREDVRSVEG